MVYVFICVSISHLPYTQEGAAEYSERGVVSSLYSENLRFISKVENANSHLSSLPSFKLLFDPQTSGGLMASVGSAHATTALQELHNAGYTSARVIGIVSGPCFSIDGANLVKLC